MQNIAVILAGGTGSRAGEGDLYKGKLMVM